MAGEHLISLQPGTVIASRYEVVKCLGAGSMGLVYACRHRELSGHLVAVKVLFPEVAQDKIAAARFRNEIFASYGVSHPNVVRAYEYLRDGDLVAYTMEYVGGGDLAERLGRPDDAMPIPEIIRVLGQMCSGVQAIHDAGIVHRDLKPENILLTKDGAVKIADFGIARTGHGPKLTEHGGVVGTIDYVSPEYMINSQVDWRSDIYAIGILGYEMITGESPFRGDSVYATMAKRIKSDPKPPSAYRPECPPELDNIILKAMQRNPETRYQSAAEMFYDLQPLSPEVGPIGSGVLQAGRNSTASYVGPVHSPPDPDAISIVGADGNVATIATPSAPAAESLPSVAAFTGAAAVRTPSGGKSDQLAASGFYDTRVQSPEISELASHYRDNDEEVEPMRMERVLAYTDLAPEDWTRSPMSPDVSLMRGGIDDSRIKRLSELVDPVSRSLWVDVVTLAVAILIGVGVGFAILKLVFPEVLERRAVAPSGAVDVSVYDE